eukprot:GFUD01080834.1.p1 GENE.GFUD01080834.1~~GFUD01080834.1.p1  ORF type:complete len:317 (-),score=31.28 GFUD01080834.1:105-1055(-)
MMFWTSLVPFLLVNELHQSKAAKLYDAAEAAAIEEIENMSAKELLNLAQTVAESEELMEARQIRKKRGVTHLATKLLPGLAAAGVLNTVGLGALVGKAGLVGGAAKVIGAKLNGAGTLLGGTNPGGEAVATRSHGVPASKSRKKRGGLHLLGHGVTHLAKKLLPGLAAAGVLNTVGLGALVGKAKLVGGAAKLIGAKAAIGGATSTGGADDCHDVPHQQCTWEPVEKCHDVVECHDEPATWCKNVPHEKCWDEPHERCWDEPQEKCWDEPREKCWEEPHEKCWQEPHEKCWEVPHENCEDVIVKVAKKWCEEEVWK